MLTSKERLLRCIAHKPIDRVPISTYELVGYNESSWENSQPSYKHLMDVIREKTDCIYMLDPELKTSECTMPEREEWREGVSRFTKEVWHSSKGDLSSLHRQDDNINTVWTIEHTLKTIEDIDNYLSMPYEAPQIDMTTFESERKKLGDKGLMMISVSDPICVGAELFEMSDFLVYAITEEEKISYFLDAIFERQQYVLKEILKHDVKDVIFRICGPEYATIPYLSPKYHEKYVLKYLIPVCRQIREAGGIPRIHSHGKIGSVIEQYTRTEAMAIDPVEPIPDGDIALSEIKRRFGGRFCIFGNIELKELENSSTDRIEELVRNAMIDAKKGSGFVIMPTACPINSPLARKMEENYICYIESALKYGRYL